MERKKEVHTVQLFADTQARTFDQPTPEPTSQLEIHYHNLRLSTLTLNINSRKKRQDISTLQPRSINKRLAGQPFPDPDLLVDRVSARLRSLQHVHRPCRRVGKHYDEVSFAGDS